MREKEYFTGNSNVSSRWIHAEEKRRRKWIGANPWGKRGMPHGLMVCL